MAGVKRFEDLRAWQFARELTKSVYSATKARAFEQDFGLRNQLRGASVSLMANIAEGLERLSAREFRRFLLIAKASGGEVRSLLYVALDAGYISPECFESLVPQVRRAIGATTALAKSLATRPHLAP